MASFMIFGNSTTPRTLADDEFGVIGSGGSLSVAGVAITSEDDVLLTILGRLYGRDGAVLHGDGTLVMNVGDGARVNSASGDTIEAFDLDQALVTNAGRILSREDAIDVRGNGPVNINNSGTITADSDGIVTEAIGSRAEIVNTGSITGVVGGIDHLDGGDSSLVNRGRIVGEENYGFSGADGADQVLNTGTIRGGVFLLEGADSVTNRGYIDRIELGDGGDVYLASGEGRSGLVKGGGGQDFLFGGRQNDVFNGGQGGDFFVFGRNGGNDRILDLETGDKIDLGVLRLDNFAEVKAAAEDVTQGCLLDFEEEFGLTVLLIGVERDELRASHFILEPIMI